MGPKVMALKPRCRPDGPAAAVGAHWWGHQVAGQPGGRSVQQHGQPGAAPSSSRSCLPCPSPCPIPARRFHVCLQQALAERNGSSGVPEGEHDDSEEDAKGMARLFAEVGEAYTGLIAEGGPQVGLGPGAASGLPVVGWLRAASRTSGSERWWEELACCWLLGVACASMAQATAPPSHL